MCEGSIAAGGSRVLWPRREFGIRILKGLTGCHYKTSEVLR
jgi:hypothetical protein